MAALGYGLIYLCIMLVMACSGLPWWVIVIVWIPVVMAAIQSVRCQVVRSAKEAVVGILYQEHTKRWLVLTRSGRLVAVNLLEDSVMMASMLWLRYRDIESRRRWGILIAKDAMQPDDYRCLRRWLWCQ